MALYRRQRPGTYDDGGDLLDVDDLHGLTSPDPYDANDRGPALGSFSRRSARETRGARTSARREEVDEGEYKTSWLEWAEDNALAAGVGGVAAAAAGRELYKNRDRIKQYFKTTENSSTSEIPPFANANCKDAPSCIQDLKPILVNDDGTHAYEVTNWDLYSTSVGQLRTNSGTSFSFDDLLNGCENPSLKRAFVEGSRRSLQRNLEALKHVISWMPEGDGFAVVTERKGKLEKLLTDLETNKAFESFVTVISEMAPFYANNRCLFDAVVAIICYSWRPLEEIVGSSVLRSRPPHFHMLIDTLNDLLQLQEFSDVKNILLKSHCFIDEYCLEFKDYLKDPVLSGRLHAAMSTSSITSISTDFSQASESSNSSKKLFWEEYVKSCKRLGSSLMCIAPEKLSDYFAETAPLRFREIPVDAFRAETIILTALQKPATVEVIVQLSKVVQALSFTKSFTNFMANWLVHELVTPSTTVITIENFYTALRKMGKEEWNGEAERLEKLPLEFKAMAAVDGKEAGEFIRKFKQKTFIRKFKNANITWDNNSNCLSSTGIFTFESGHVFTPGPLKLSKKCKGDDCVTRVYSETTVSVRERGVYPFDDSKLDEEKKKRLRDLRSKSVLQEELITVRKGFQLQKIGGKKTWSYVDGTNYVPEFRSLE